MRFFLIITLLSTLAYACQKQPVIPIDPRIEDPFNKEYPGVFEELWPHFENFEREADLRGISIDLKQAGITGRITDIIGPVETSGTCFYHEDKPNAIIIDSLTWAVGTDLLHELIVFHELGHCSLLRDHLDEVSPKGYCISIMRSNSDVCIDTYSKENRDRFLDELFGK